MTAVKISPVALRDAIQRSVEDSTKMSGVFTARSLKTGKDFTFKVTRNEFANKWYTHVYVEQGYMEFKHMGFLTREGQIVKKRQVVSTPAALAASWILRMIWKDINAVETQVELFHLGKCLKCNKTLTDATSIEIGLGPVCRGDQ